MFGYLYLTEKKVKKELQGILDKFDQRQGWCAKFIKMGSPAETPEKVQEKCAIYNTYLADIKRKLKQDKIPLKNMRVYVEQLSSLIKQVESISDLPTPDAGEAPAAPAAEPTVAGYGYYGAATPEKVGFWARFKSFFRKKRRGRKKRHRAGMPGPPPPPSAPPPPPPTVAGYFNEVETASFTDDENVFDGYGQVSTALRDDQVNLFDGYGQVSTAMRGDEVNPFDGYGQVSTAMRGDEVNPFAGYGAWGKGRRRKGKLPKPAKAWGRRRRRRGPRLFCERRPDHPRCQRPGNLNGIFANWDWSS